MPSFREVFQAIASEVPPHLHPDTARFLSLEQRLAAAPREWILSAARQPPLRLVVTVAPEEAQAATAWLTLAAGYELGLSPSSRVLLVSGSPNNGKHFDTTRAVREGQQRGLFLKYAAASGGLSAPNSRNSMAFGPLGSDWSGRTFTGLFVDNPFRATEEAADPEVLERTTNIIRNITLMRLGQRSVAIVLAPPRTHVEGGDFVGRLLTRGWEWVDMASDGSGL